MIDDPTVAFFSEHIIPIGEKNATSGRAYFARKPDNTKVTYFESHRALTQRERPQPLHEDGSNPFVERLKALWLEANPELLPLVLDLSILVQMLPDPAASESEISELLYVLF
jgi:hypothetical protein